jgi:predicted ester cyclase
MLCTERCEKQQSKPEATSRKGETTVATMNNATQIHRIFEEGMNQRKAGVFDELIAPAYVNHNLPIPVPGAEGFKRVVELFQNAFPDFHVDVAEVISDIDIWRVEDGKLVENWVNLDMMGMMQQLGVIPA